MLCRESQKLCESDSSVDSGERFLSSLFLKFSLFFKISSVSEEIPGMLERQEKISYFRLILNVSPAAMCGLSWGKKALFGILLLKTICRDDDNKITSFRMQWLEKGAVDGPEADVAMAQNRLIENLQSAFPQMLVENPARVKPVCPHCTPSTAKPLQAAGGIRGRVHYKTRMAHRPE